VLVNNAGYGLLGAVEEVSDVETRAQMETNFFGALAVTRAALPHLRRQKSGHILQISSIGGVNGTPGAGIYNRQQVLRSRASAKRWPRRWPRSASA